CGGADSARYKTVIPWSKTEHGCKISTIQAVQACVFLGIAVAEPTRIEMITRARLADRAGYSLMEIMIVVALTGVIAAIAIPMMGNSLGFFRLSGDARAISNSLALAKMRAASVFGRVRIYFDLSARSFHLETWNGATNQWVSDAGGVTYLSQGVN